MTRETLERKENELLDNILLLGSMVEKAILKSIEALGSRDLSASEDVIREDDAINEKRVTIEEEALVTIATQQPMATDLRLLASILDIVTELERMGDYAKGIARINLKLGDAPLIKPLVDIPKMAEIAVDMLHRSLLAFIEQDPQLARQIHKEDDRIDDLYHLVYDELFDIMLNDRKKLDQANHLLWVAHNIERLADRVTNICERTIFVATGKLVELD